MAQSGVIINIQHQLADILDNQKLILNNQSGIINRLGKMECRLLGMEAQFYLKNQNGNIQNSDKTIQSFMEEIKTLKGLYEAKSENGKAEDNDMESDEIKSNSDEDLDDESEDDENTRTSSNSDKMSQSAMNNIECNEYISAAELKKICKVSKSRGNFAALTVQNLFDKNERASSNVMGSRGKRQLSPNRMKVVKKLTFDTFPPKNGSDEDSLWKRECIKAIDSKNRKIKIASDASSSAANSTASSTCVFKVKLDRKKQ